KLVTVMPVIAPVVGLIWLARIVAARPVPPPPPVKVTAGGEFGLYFVPPLLTVIELIPDVRAALPALFDKLRFTVPAKVVSVLPLPSWALTTRVNGTLTNVDVGGGVIANCEAVTLIPLVVTVAPVIPLAVAMIM